MNLVITPSLRSDTDFPFRIQPDVPDPHRTLGRGEGLFEARNRSGNLRQLQASVGVQQREAPLRSRADWVGFQERDLSQVLGGVAGITGKLHRLERCFLDWTTAVAGKADTCQLHLPQQWSNLRSIVPIYEVYRY